MEMVALPKRHTAVRLTDLEHRLDVIEPQVDRGRRQRKLIFIVAAALTLVQTIEAGLIVYLLVGRADSRAYYNDQIRMLVCAVPPGDETRNLLRERAQCGPYTRPSDLPRRSASSSRPAAVAPRSSSATPAPPARADVPDLQPPTTARPSARRTVRAPESTSRPPTSTQQSPRPSASRTRPSAAAPSSANDLLPDLLCTVLGCPSH